MERIKKHQTYLCKSNSQLYLSNDLGIVIRNIGQVIKINFFPSISTLPKQWLKGGGRKEGWLVVCFRNKPMRVDRGFPNYGDGE